MLTATNTLSQLQKKMDVIGHNISNIDTNGFKRRETNFTDLLVQQFNNNPEGENEIGRLTPLGIRQGTGSRVGQVQMVMEQGSIKPTSRDLDTAFTTEGQFYRVSVQNENGTSTIQYTRDGALYLSPVSEEEMILVTSSGHPVLDENNDRITINGQAKEYQISKEGRLTVLLEGGGQQNFDLGITLVNKPQFLEQKGDNLLGLPENFAELGVDQEDIVTDLNGLLRDQVSIQQRALESSNVDLSKEMTDLMQVQRSYQFQSRSINLADQMMGLINGIR